MCGIFAYIGHDNRATLKTLKGLRDLEYRGYDSWGIATKTDNGFFCKKGVGKISAVKEHVFKHVSGTISIGHTRWATHGKVSLINTHPHFNRHKTIAVVHNGIIENYHDLRKEVEKYSKGNIFRTHTDTEIIPHFLDFYMKRGFSFEESFMHVCKRLKGRFACVAFHKDFPFVLAARNGSPLVVGVGEGEYYIASDIPAFLDYTNKVYLVSNGEYLKIDDTGASFFKFENGEKVIKKHEKVMWKKEKASKGGWEHFMLKEIMEQKEVLQSTLLQDDIEVKRIAAIIRKLPDIFLTASGTAGYMCMVAEYLFSRYAGVNAHFVPATEFQKNTPFLNQETLLLTVTQSGETADLLEAIEIAQEKKSMVVSVVNVRGSSVERESVFVLPANAGPEKAVASTKAATTQLVVFMLLVYALMRKYEEGEVVLAHEIKKIDEWLTGKLLAHIKKIARPISKHNHMYLIGKSVLYPVALEAALKIKEVSYIHAEGFSSGELKHGPIALIEKGTPCVVFVGDDEFKDDVLLSAEELSSRGAYILGVASEEYSVFDSWIPVPKLKITSPIVHIITAQILAYHLAVLKGHDPDKPRNLAKSVTVK